jgi:4'-phosphopantetheinyl transferase
MSDRHPPVETLRFPRLTLEDLTRDRPACRLPPRVVWIHAFALDAPADVQDRCGQWLSPPERERAARFRFEEDRRRYVVAHGYLRRVLGAYCGTPPASVELCEGAGGKPVLRNAPAGVGAVTFSLTHSHGRALVAVGAGLDAGVDLEQVREEVDCAALAERFFARREWQAIMAAEPAGRRRAFFRHWVGKEAVLKARGTGLRAPLHQCELRFSSDDTAAVELPCAPPERCRLFTARFLPLEGDWIGAVAADGADWRWAYSAPA